MPSLGGVPPSDYQIMEIIIESSEPIFPVTVVIYDEKGKPVFSDTFYSSPLIILPPMPGSKVVITPQGPLEPSEVQIVVCVPQGK
jgi:hypothetical protein